MTADVIQDRRVTVPAHGVHTVFVDWSRLFWALPSHPVHEGLWSRAFHQKVVARTGYKVMRIFRMRRLRPTPGLRPLVDRATAHPDFPASRRVQRPSRRGLSRATLVASTEQRPALTAAAHGALPKWRSGRRSVSVEQRSIPPPRDRKRSLFNLLVFPLTSPIQGAGLRRLAPLCPPASPRERTGEWAI